MAVIVKEWNANKALQVIQKRMKDGMIGLGKAIRDDARQNCPVETGRLRASITVNWSGSGKRRASTGRLVRGEALSLYGTKISTTQKVSLEEDGVGEPTTQANTFTVVVGSNVPYAPMVEFGTAKMGKKAFLRPAIHKYANFFSSKMSISFYAEGYSD